MLDRFDSRAWPAAGPEVEADSRGRRPSVDVAARLRRMWS